jgi:hypothetical protein
MRVPSVKNSVGRSIRAATALIRSEWTPRESVERRIAAISRQEQLWALLGVCPVRVDARSAHRA